jgi:hypothetical protein
MGGGASGPASFTKPSSRSHVPRSTEEIVGLLMPVYFTDIEPSKEDVELAQQKWNLIIDDESEHFKKKKGQPGYTQASCVSLFFDSFYKRLFDIHPVSLSIFVLFKF